MSNILVKARADGERKRRTRLERVEETLAPAAMSRRGGRVRRLGIACHLSHAHPKGVSAVSLVSLLLYMTRVSFTFVDSNDTFEDE